MPGKDYTNAPADGVYVNGLFLDGGRWNPVKACLDESLPRVLYEDMPIVIIKQFFLYLITAVYTICK